MSKIRPLGISLLIFILGAVSSLAVPQLVGAEEKCPPIDTVTTMTLVRNPAIAGEIVKIIGTVKRVDNSLPVTVGFIKIQQLRHNGQGVPMGTPGAHFVTIAQGAPDANGQSTYNFNTSGFDNKSLGWRVKYVPGGPNHFHPSQSSGQDLIIYAANCSRVIWRSQTRFVCAETRELID